MTWYLIAWIALSCPGGMFQKLIPDSAKPFLCEAEPKTKIVSTKREAHKLVTKKGCGAKLFKCKGLRCRGVDISCYTLLEINGVEAGKL